MNYFLSVFKFYTELFTKKSSFRLPLFEKVQKSEIIKDYAIM